MIPDDKTLPTPDPARVQMIRSYGPGHFLIGERDWREAGAGHGIGDDSLEGGPRRGAVAGEPRGAQAGDAAAGIAGAGLRRTRGVRRPGDAGRAQGGGLSLEVVDTGSACRIYNVLLAESRRVAAALIPL